MGYDFKLGISDYFTGSTVANAVAGGMLLGFAVIFKTLVLSGVMGVSTYSKRIMLQIQLKRYLFIFGMILSGFAVDHLYGGVEPLPRSYWSDSRRNEVLVRCACGAFLVGLGSSMQGGCTSGHGLTGLARLSLRSWVAVPAFMGAGFVVATLTKSSETFPPDPATIADTPEWGYGFAVTGGGAVVLVASGCVCWLVTRYGSSPHLFTAAVFFGEFIVGIAFGCGLFVSGMARPSKVVGFLDIGSGMWDLTLAFVMCGALAFTFPFFQAIHFGCIHKALLHEEHFDLPPRSAKPDLVLVVGAVIFGSGWAIGGMCPGPIWVNVGANPSWEVLLAVVGLQLGVLCWEGIRRLREHIRNKVRKADTEQSEATWDKGSAPKAEDKDGSTVEPWSGEQA